MDLDVPSWARLVVFRVFPLLITFAVARFVHRGYTIRRRFKILQAQGVPLMPHSWLWGHLPMLLRFGRERPADISPLQVSIYLMEKYAEFTPGHEGNVPPVLYLDIWPVDNPLMIVIDPNLTAQFTQDTNLPKHDAYVDIVGALTNAEDLLASKGEFWKYWRARFNPGFSARSLQTLIPDLLEEAVTFLEVMTKRAGTDGKWGDVFPLEDDAINLTLDTITRAALDVRLHEQRGNPSRFRTAFLRQGKYMTLEFDILRIFNPINPIRQWRLHQNDQTMKDFFVSKIRQRMEATSTPQKKFIVDPVLESREKDGSGRPGSTDITDAEFMHGLVQNLKMIIYAGHDTTATTICRAYFLLQRNPDCLQKLWAEHDAVFGPDPDAAQHRLREQPQLLNSLPYTVAVIKETLRLYPPGTTIRQGQPGFSLTKSGFPPLPTEDFVLWDGMQAAHRNPEFWPRPKEFIPERYLVAEDDPLHPPKNAWRAFEHPPRSCIGQDLAVMEIKLVLVLVSRKFEIETAWDQWDLVHPGKKDAVNGERLYETGTTTVHLKDGMPVRVRVRS